MGENTGEKYGVFTLERQDLVDLSARIAACIPKDFLKHKDKPVIIAVDGSVGCGKKIVADYGRAALLKINHEDIVYPPKYPELIFAPPLTFFQKLKNAFKFFVKEKEPEAAVTRCSVESNGQDLDCRGHGEYDEYVSAEIDGDKIDISFINMAWGYGYSFGSDDDARARYRKHMDKRQGGGILYAHNMNIDDVRPDIEIKLECGSGSTCLNGHDRSCHDVDHAISMVAGEDDARAYSKWGRFVSVQFNNATLDHDGIMSKMLKAEFGFRALKDIPAKLLEFSELREEGEAAINIADFPVAKKHAAHLREAHARHAAGESEKYNEIKIGSPAPCLDKVYV